MLVCFYLLFQSRFSSSESLVSISIFACPQFTKLINQYINLCQFVFSDEFMSAKALLKKSAKDLLKVYICFISLIRTVFHNDGH